MQGKQAYGRPFTALEQRAWEQFEQENTIDPNVAKVIPDTFVRERRQERAEDEAEHQEREEARRVQGYIRSRQISKDQAEQYLREDATLKQARAIIEKNLARNFYKDRGERKGARVLLDSRDHRMTLTVDLAAEIVRHDQEYYVNYKRPLWRSPFI